MASDRRDSQPSGSRFVGEIDHDEIKHIEVTITAFGQYTESRSCLSFIDYSIGGWKRSVWNGLQGKMA